VPPVGPPPPAVSHNISPSQHHTGSTNSIASVQLKKNVHTEVRQAIGNSTVVQSREPKPTVQMKPYDGPERVVLLISRHWVVSEWIQENIKKVLFINEQSYEGMIKEKPEAIAEFLHIEKFPNLASGMVEWKAEQLHNQYHFTHVVVLAEEDLIRGARIRQSLGISHGQNVEEALRYRDKIVMKTILRENNIQVPTFAPVESASDVLDFVRKHGNQIVVKPRKGYSSVNTWIIKNDKDLQTLLSSDSNTVGGFDSALDLDVETFVNGQMYHIDGIVYDGQVKLCWPSRYVNICADFQNSKFLASYTLSPTNPLCRRLQEFTVASIKALGGPSCFPFHMEAWVTPEDEIVFCEIGSRTGGAWVRHVIWRLFEIMQDKTFTQWQIQQDITHPELGDNWEEREPAVAELAGWMFIYPKVGTIEKIPPACPLQFVAFSQTFGVVGETFKSRLNCVDSVFSAIFTGSNEEEMEKNALHLFNWFESEINYIPLST